VARGVKWPEVTEGLGTRFEAALNTYKPFACGIVTHPAIDAAIQLRNETNLKPGDITAVELIANPLVLSLTGKTEPRTGLEGKFSVTHCIAAGLIYGAAGERQFQDAVVRDATLVALRRKVTVHPDPKVGAAQCTLMVKLKDGRTLTRRIEHAIGSLEKPMSDAALQAKFTDLAEGILAKDQTRRVMDMCWSIEKAPDAGALAEAAQA
jgi:2-methylcitrate dehydratase PrpD